MSRTRLIWTNKNFETAINFVEYIVYTIVNIIIIDNKNYTRASIIM